MKKLLLKRTNNNKKKKKNCIIFFFFNVFTRIKKLSFQPHTPEYGFVCAQEDPRLSGRQKRSDNSSRCNFISRASGRDAVTGRGHSRRYHRPEGRNIWVKLFEGKKKNTLYLRVRKVYLMNCLRRFPEESFRVNIYIYTRTRLWKTYKKEPSSETPQYK